MNKNSYEPQWCQRLVESQNRLVEAFCFAGAHGRSRRDLPSSHTIAGHQTAERRQTEMTFFKLLSRGGQSAKKKTNNHSDSQIPSKTNKPMQTQSYHWSAAVWWTVPLHSIPGSHLNCLLRDFQSQPVERLLYLPGFLPRLNFDWKHRQHPE